MPIAEDHVREALKEVIDPELFINIVDLGLVYDVTITPNAESGARGCVAARLRTRRDRRPGGPGRPGPSRLRPEEEPITMRSRKERRSSSSAMPAKDAKVGAIASGAGALGTLAVGSVVLGAFALGAIAVGAVAIGFLKIGRARLGRLEIDELQVRRLRVAELDVTDVLRTPNELAR
jgi:hypothetical protein